ncbi:MAG TPA: 4Fe-4S binding protein [Methanomassiliicoccales archaeon]|nr:4Fe-4S binding protein [Methanomassiliicoccales archaeon]
MKIEERTYTKADHLRPTGYIMKSMKVTFKVLWRCTKNRPNTILYPWEKLVYPDNYRGRPGIILDKCIGCARCVNVCPNQCIEMVSIETPELGKVKRPQINVARCMMCGNCAEICPTNAMLVTPEFELASYNRADMMYDPIKLQHPHKPGYEVNYEFALSSELKAGTAKTYAKNDPNMHDTIVLDGVKCISCARCAKTCPTGAIEMVETGELNPKNKKPIKRPKFENTKCVVCEQCVEVCPKSALSIKEVL